MTFTPDLSQQRFAILGTGAIGGFYGARLQQAGYDVHFLLRGDYDHVRQHGFTVESVDGDFVLPDVKAYHQVEAMPPCDVVIVALKSTQNHRLPELLSSVLHPDSIVVLLQNGLDEEAAIAQILPNHTILGGMCFICSNKVGPGQIRHLDYKAIVLGEYAPGYKPMGKTAAMQQVATAFSTAGIPISLSDDLFLDRWKKLIWNIPFNGLSVVLNAQTDEMMANPAIRVLARQLMDEVAAIAAAYNRTISEDYIQQIINHTDQMKPYLTSMKLDYDHQRPLEIEAIFGNPLRAAERVQVTAPSIQMLYQQLQFLDQRNRTIRGAQ